MSYNLINQFKKDNKITPKGILFIFMLFVIVVQSAIIIYSNLFELEHHLGFDASSAYLQAVEIWRCKSLVPSTFALTTTLGLDSLRLPHFSTALQEISFSDLESPILYLML